MRSPSPITSILQLVFYVESELKKSNLEYGQGTASASDESVFIVLTLAGLDFNCPESELEKPPSSSLLETTEALLQQRITQRKPAAYLLNKAWFCGLLFYVDERVLIPRSPFAELIQNGFSPWIQSAAIHRILEIGTGSACMAISAAHYLTVAQIDAVDIDPNALDVARINIDHHNMHERVHVFESDVYYALADKTYDIIMSNPPYVSAAEMPYLAEEFRHEPVHALQADNNGMAVMERILQGAFVHLNEGGILIGEVGHSQNLLIERYPHVPFMWLEFEYGGTGVFLLTKAQLEKYFQ